MPEETPWYLSKSPLGAGYQHFSNTAKQESVLDTKTKELIRVATASVFRCPHCTETHINEALKAGASKAEITESILLSALQAAGTQLNWQRDAFKKLLG
jgi:AhpD family alkylhydroperoxidase